MDTLDSDQSVPGDARSGSVHELAALLRDSSLTISVAESCSGGLMAKMLTDLPGSSAYFLAGVVAYSNHAKSVFLDVHPRLIEQHGAVSPQVAEAMAQGVLGKSGSDIALSVTGIAGPDGGSEEKPVGTVYLGLADRHGCRTLLARLSGSRDRIRTCAARRALEWAICHLSGTAPAGSMRHL